MRHCLGVLWLALASQAVAQPMAGTTLNICGDAANWPPYTFVKDGKTQGVDIDILHAILPVYRIRFKVEMLDWKRCLEGTEKNTYQIALSATRNKERQRKFIFTRPYYSVSTNYFYSKRQHPTGFQIHSPEDLLYHHVCGLHGYNYNTFGIDSNQVNRSSRNYDQLIKRTMAGRCDLFLANREILAGFSILGKHYNDSDMVSAQIPGARNDDFHMLISKRYRYRKALKQLLDKGIEQLEQTGGLKAIINHYLPATPPTAAE